MDFEFILRVAEKRIKSALGKSDAGKTSFSSFYIESICPDTEISGCYDFLNLSEKVAYVVIPYIPEHAKGICAYAFK